VKILFLTQVFPWPLDAGPKVRAHYVLRALMRRHDVHLVSYVRPTDPLLQGGREPALTQWLADLASVEGVLIHRSRRNDLRFLLASLLRRRSFILARDAGAAMDAALARVVAEHGPFDVVHADQLWMAPFALQAADSQQQRTGRRPRTVLDQHNACYRIFERLAAGEGNPIKRLLLANEAQKLAREEVALCARFDRVVWVTQEDAQAVAGRAAALHAPPPPVSAVIPICADPEAEPALTLDSHARRVTFLGGLHYPPNAEAILWFAREVFPAVLAQAPQAVLTVIGKSPPDALHALGIPPANLDVRGYVQEPRPLLRETAAFVAPLLAGGGMRVKIIDGWTWGLPIVSTTVGAEGIHLRDGENILLADAPDAFAAAVVRLLTNTDERNRLAAAGRAWAAERYGWRSVYGAWESVYAGEASAEGQPQAATDARPNEQRVPA
jgi:glycosyltransferase involved in cell wall biosynthesis